MFRGFLGSFLHNMMSTEKSNIEQLLDKDTTTLEQVLLDSEILTECKWGNQRLINYFDHDKVSELLDFIIKMPPTDATHNRGHKLPFIASEIFNSEISKINELFFTARTETQKSVNSQKGKDSESNRDHDEDEVNNPILKFIQDELIKVTSGNQENEDNYQEFGLEPIVSQSQHEPVVADDDGNYMRKSFGETKKGSQLEAMILKHKSNRYEINDDEEVDQDEIDLRADETLDHQIINGQTTEEQPPQVQEQETDAQEVKIDDQQMAEEQEQEEEEEVVLDQEQMVIVDDQEQNLVEDDDQTLSTAPTMKEVEKKEANPYELFEKLLSFVDTDEELNSVLSGYFCKLFQVLVGNKPKEVFSYVYSHPEVLDNLVKHVSQKSVSEVLIRLLNVSENILDDGFSGDFDAIRQSFIYKLVQKFDPHHSSFEDNLNAQSLLSELVEYKIVYTELTNKRTLDLLKQYLESDNASSKANIYQLLQNIVAKYKSNEHFSKKINISNFQDCTDEINLEDEEDVLIFKDDKESEFFTFVKEIIQTSVAKELLIPPEEEQEDFHSTSYGFCKLPFGLVRIRAVEFLAQAFQVFQKDIHQTFADADLYNTLLFFFEHYPFHNVLHLKVSEIFTLALEKNTEEVINHLLYQTSLIKKILDTSRDGTGIHTFSYTNQTVNKGFLAFVRKLANKLVDLSHKNEEVSNFLESIPEWSEYFENVLTAINNIENKPLASDPRKKDLNTSDDYFDMIYKLKDVRSGSGYRNKKQENTDQDNNNEDENGNEEDNNKLEFDFSNHDGLTNKKSRNSRGGYQEQQQDDDEEEDDNDFERLIGEDNDDENQDTKQEDNNDLHQYFSNGDDQQKKPWEENEEEDSGEPLSMDDLQKNDHLVLSPHFGGEETQVNEENNTQQQEVESEVLTVVSEVPSYHEQFYWKINLIQNESIDALLQDYE